ncbi:DNA-deoxyinosine glycosylase [Caulobacter henricii]|uniref:DNA-deoxyinosine glycosylase n=1 Tax=Caulobacter henricii TaxID=69395 RepID=A0A0N7JHA3_9CAUL|nr:DNA-deoxyinosine glycosylase [Caulobacter henricii]ALL12834.1 DNA-deoxyinosine glycosylase [Caulobacter henricii]
MVAERKRSFPPVVDANTRVLILGSLPGEASLAAGQYYANPRNAFWRLLEGVLDTPLVARPYADRLSALRARGIGLWDVVAEAERRGSLDAAILNPRANDLLALVESLPALRAVAFNGGTAAKLGRRLLASLVDSVALITLPSSSPAHAAQSFEDKALAWNTLSVRLA